MKLSKEAVKRIFLVAVVVGLFEIYDYAKKHSKEKIQESKEAVFTPPHPEQQEQWFAKQYVSAIKKCIPSLQDFKRDPYLTKLAYLYQSQIHSVELEYPSVKRPEQLLVAQNQFYRLLNDSIEGFGARYAKEQAERYQSVNIADTLKQNPADAYINAAIHRIGAPDQRQMDSYSIAVNTRDVAKQEYLVKTKYIDMPSIQTAQILLLAQFKNDEASNSIRQLCFKVLESHPSLVVGKNNTE